jgi:hypothetical protein
MKLQFTLLLSLICCATFGQKKYTLKPDAQGYLIIRGTYLPGDTLMLDGSFKAVAVYDLKGSIDKPITITNVPGKVLYIGDSTWSGGSWSHGLAIRNCRYLNVCGTTRNNFRITGSNSTALDNNGYPVKTAYFNLLIGELTEDIVVHDISIRHGGAGVSCKTDINSGSPRTYGSTPLSNFEFYNMDIYNTYNEGFYIGVTASTADAAGRFAVKLNNVMVHNNKLWHIGNDAIQIASSDNVEVYDNDITDWAVKKESSHCGGILMGGRCNGSMIYNNRVYNGWGEMLQIFSDGPCLVRNNLFANNSLTAVFIRGGKGLIVRFVRNTVALAGDYAIRINGAFGSTGKQLIDSNIIAQPSGGTRYYYLENGGTMTDLNNKTFTTVTDAKLNTLLNYEPLVTSSARGYGYSSTTIVTPPDPEQPAPKLSFSITFPTITLPEGSHVLKLTTPDGKVSDVKIVVAREQ